MDITDLLAAGTILVVAAVTVWAIRAQPGAWQAFMGMWRDQPWARQIYFDFYGLEIVLALWMLTHAAAAGTWISAIVCLVLMPVFGSMAAAAYWLLSV